MILVVKIHVLLNVKHYRDAQKLSGISKVRHEGYYHKLSVTLIYSMFVSMSDGYTSE